MSSYSQPRIPLLPLLSHRRCRTALLRFALQSHCEESLCFISDVEGLRELHAAWQAERPSIAGPEDVQQPEPRPMHSERGEEEDELLREPSVSRIDSGSVALRDFSFPIAAAAGLRLSATRSVIVNASGEAVSAVSLVSEAATGIWLKYQPGSQWAVSWHPEELRAVTAGMRAGDGQLHTPLLFNGQQELEIDVVQSGTLSRFYATHEYRRLCHHLLAELALSFQHALAAAQSSSQAATAQANLKLTVATSSVTSPLHSTSLLSAIAEAEEHGDSGRETRLTGTVNMSTIMRMPTAISVSCTPERRSAPTTPPDRCDSPASPASLPSPDSDDEKTATPPFRQNSSLHILLPPREQDTRQKLGPAPPLHAMRRLRSLASVSPAVVSSPGSPGLSSPGAGELELLHERGFSLFHSSPLGSELLRAYMASEWSVDNYDCLLRIEAFGSRAMTDSSRRRAAAAIFHSFLSSNSKHEVTFPCSMRAALQRRLSSQSAVSCSLFDQVQTVLLQTVRIDVFRRFVRSAAYQRLRAEMRDSLTESGTQAVQPSIGRVSQASLSLIRPAALSFADVLNDSQLLAAYSAFCQREHSEEYVLFYQSVQRYRQLDRGDPEAIYNAVQRIHARYVVENADYQVHFPLQLKMELKRGMAYPHPELYDKAVAFVVAVMREDSGRRFLSRNAVRKRSAS